MELCGEERFAIDFEAGGDAFACFVGVIEAEEGAAAEEEGAGALGFALFDGEEGVEGAEGGAFSLVSMRDSPRASQTSGSVSAGAS